MGPKVSPFRRRLKLLLIAFLSVVLVYLVLDNIVMPLYTQQGRTTVVPEVVGLPLDQARSLIVQAGLEPVEAETKPDRKVPVGSVSLQNPSPLSVVKYGRGVYLTVSGGEVMVEVPSLRGRSLRDATFTLERAGLRIGDVRYEPSEDIFLNTVISQSVEPERKVRSGSAVSVVVSQGRPGEKRSVPNIVGRSLQEAERLLVQSGLTLGSVTLQPSYELLPNTVMDQYPRAGELAPFGQPVDLFVAKKGEAPPQLEN